MRRWRSSIAFSLLFCFLIGGVGGPVVHLALWDADKSSPHPPHRQVASTTPQSFDFSTSSQLCAHVPDHQLDCLLCNTLVLDLSPGTTIVSTIHPLISLLVHSAQRGLRTPFALASIRAPPTVGR